MRFRRNIEKTPVEAISPYRLPMKGSRDKAFVEMNFRWRGDYDPKSRLRQVVLPSGFVIEEMSSDLLIVADSNKYPRASIGNPSEGIPFILPVKRFNPGVEEVSGGWRMLVNEWNKVLVRGKVFATGADALKSGSDWLADNKPGWDSYIARVNFRASPPKWNLFV